MDKLYPELSEQGKEEASNLLEEFKKQMAGAAEEIIGNFYTDTMMYIESDSWMNFRNSIAAGLCNYGDARVSAKFDCKKIRQSIYNEFREELIEDLNKDMLKEIEDLKKQVNQLRESNERICRRSY